jgi:hypothetical protein
MRTYIGHGALRGLLGALAFGAVIFATRDASALIQRSNPFLGLPATAYIGHDPTDNHEWIAWMRHSDGLCEWQDLDNGHNLGFDDNILINASGSGDTIVILQGSGTISWCHSSLQAPRYNGHSCDLNGGSGNDYLSVGSGDSYIYGNGGSDVLSNNGGAALQISGGSGDDSISAGTTNFGSTTGDGGNDCLRISTAATNATISCGAGVDSWGGPGSMPADCETFDWSCCPGFVC